MKPLGRTGFTAWLLLALWCLSYPESAHAQIRGGLGQRGRTNSPESVPGFSGPRGFGLPDIPGPFPFAGGMERQTPGRFLQREIGPLEGVRRRFNSSPSDLNSGQLYQAADGNWYYSDGRAWMPPSRSDVNAGQPSVNAAQPNSNPAQPYLAVDGNWYYPDGRLYKTAQTATNPGQPYLAVDGNWYYPDGRPYKVAQPAVTTGQPYLAVDGKWYYPDGRPYIPPVDQPVTPASTASATPQPAIVRTPPTPAPNVIPDQEQPDTVALNLVRTRLPAAPSKVREKLAQELPRSLEERIDRLESRLRPALFSEADEAGFLAIYKRSFTEDTPQFRLARVNIKSLNADELRQGLSIDQIVDAGAQIYPAKLEVSEKLGKLKKQALEGRLSAELDQAAKALLDCFERIARSPEFTSIKIAEPDQVRAEVARLHSLFEVRQKLAEAREASGEAVVTMGKRFWVVAYPGLPKDTVNAIDPRICLCGTGTGTVGVREAGLEDLGVPLLNREVSPLPDTPRPVASSRAIVSNSKTSPTTVHYVADNASYDLKPGQSRTHQVKANSRISYNRGGSLGNQEYRLDPGMYRFAIEDRAWQLTKPTVSVVIDNSANGCDFQCNIDGQPKVIPARKTFKFDSEYPVSIRFDRGDGQPASSKLIDDTLQVTVGVAPGSAALDLFAGSSQELCIRPLASDAIASLPDF